LTIDSKKKRKSTQRNTNKKRGGRQCCFLRGENSILQARLIWDKKGEGEGDRSLLFGKRGRRKAKVPEPRRGKKEG